MRRAPGACAIRGPTPSSSSSSSSSSPPPPPPEHLAEKILSARANLDEERKQVTVLFADVMGSMELAEQTDAEAWRGIMERFFQILCDGVHRFEGTVDKFTGDGVSLPGERCSNSGVRRQCADRSLKGRTMAGQAGSRTRRANSPQTLPIRPFFGGI